MADVDEDVIHPSHPGTAERDGDEDGEDETFDFRFLSSLNLTATASGALPKRGLKDFEPHPTALQSNTLAASRDAMRDALSHTRMHVPKSHVVGIYNAETGLVRVTQIKGQMFRNIGKDVSGGGVDLLPEEALWALERGSLDIRWDAGSVYTTDGGLPMSLQGAYAAFIGEEEEGRGNLTIEKYQVYAGLKRVGYTVLRAEGWDGQDNKPLEGAKVEKTAAATSGVFLWLRALFANPSYKANTLHQQIGPLVRPGLYRTYDDIYSSLHTIASQPVTFKTEVPNQPSTTPFRTTWNVYKSNVTFRKSAPPPPSFRICVVSARDTNAPTLQELSSLLARQKQDQSPTNPADPKKQPGGVGGAYARLKNGSRSVVIAVVDEGIVSYIRWAGSNFSQEKMYERGVGSARGKGGGGRGGRGGGGTRGRGRGRDR